jgi:hypothetical protein
VDSTTWRSKGELSLGGDPTQVSGGDPEKMPA